jgi:hypothetical protein
MADLKKLPVGLQSFPELIEENYIYVDKTRLILQMITSRKTVFLSWPRRFGKSLLVSWTFYESIKLVTTDVRSVS